MERYTLEMLSEKKSREAIKQEFKEKEWDVRVQNTMESFGFFAHPAFEKDIYFNLADFNESPSFTRGTLFKIRIVVRWDHKRKTYGYAGIPLLIDPQKISALSRAADEHINRALPISTLSSEISIYIDERWPGEENGAAETEKNIGVITGVVWDADQSDETSLSSIENHLNNYPEMAVALTNLLSNINAIPFMFSFKMKGIGYKKEYLDLIRASIKLLLGWVLEPKINTTLNFNLENIAAFTDGKSKNEFFRGVLEEAKTAHPERFTNWNIKQVIWRAKDSADAGYIAYADLIAKLYKTSTSGKATLATAAEVDKWPGNIRVSDSLLPALAEIEKLTADSGDIKCVFTLLDDIGSTALGNHILEVLDNKVKTFPSLRNRLVEELENRYRARERDLPRLRKSLQIIGKTIGAPDSLGLRSKFIWALLEIQNANHHGDPEAAKKHLSVFNSLKNEIIQSDPVLTSEGALNLAVHFNDQFRFEDAQIINENLLDIKQRLPRLSVGRCYSSLGQSYAIAQNFSEADNAFNVALEAFRKEAELGIQVAKDIDQTSVYKAINIINSGDSNAESALLEWIDDPIEAAETFGEGSDLSTAYHHHLFLKSLWYNVFSVQAKEHYLDKKDLWFPGNGCHPWELIALYRALLLEDSAESKEWFDTAISIVKADAHGATLKLIGAAIGAAAYCRHGDEKYKVETLNLLDVAYKFLPAASRIIQKLKEVLDSPDESKIPNVLKLLPFNYH